MSKKKDKKASKKKDVRPSEKEVIAYIKTRMAKIFGPEVPIEEAVFTVTFKDGSEKSWDVVP